MATDRHARASLSTWGIAALLSTKAADLVSTVYGLAFVDGVAEMNPVVRAVVGHVGLAGLVASAAVGTLLVVLVVEWGVDVMDRLDAAPQYVVALYVGSYGTLAALYSVATVNNLSLILRLGS